MTIHRIQLHWLKRNFDHPDRILARQLGTSHASVHRMLNNFSGSAGLKMTNALYAAVEATRINPHLTDPSLLLPQFDLHFAYAVFCPKRGWLVFPQNVAFWIQEGELQWSKSARYTTIEMFSKPVPQPKDPHNFIYVRDLEGSHLWEKKPVNTPINFIPPDKIKYEPVIKFKPEHNWDYKYD